jgi:hypothetical protein
MTPDMWCELLELRENIRQLKIYQVEYAILFNYDDPAIDFEIQELAQRFRDLQKE